MDVKEEHPVKARSQNVVTLSLNVTLEREEQFSKTASAISVIPLPIVTDTKPVA